MEWGLTYTLIMYFVASSVALAFVSACGTLTGSSSKTAPTVEYPPLQIEMGSPTTESTESIITKGTRRITVSQRAPSATPSGEST